MTREEICKRILFERCDLVSGNETTEYEAMLRALYPDEDIELLIKQYSTN